MDLKEDAFLLLFCVKQNNKFHDVLCLKSNRPHLMSKYGKNISDTLSCAFVTVFCSYHI